VNAKAPGDDRMMVVLARPRDSLPRKDGRTYESYRTAGEWVTDGYDDSGEWLWTHYGSRPMSRTTAMKLARTWCSPKIIGSKGGKASAAALTPEQRKDRARKAVRARWAKAKRPTP